MIVIASQKIDTKDGTLTVELLKHPTLSKYYVYDSNELNIADCVSANAAINLYSSYAAVAVTSGMTNPDIELYETTYGGELYEGCF